jgi:hypothetical protein
LILIGNIHCNQSEQIINPAPDDNSTIVGRHGQLSVDGIEAPRRKRRGIFDL